MEIKRSDSDSTDVYDSKSYHAAMCVAMMTKAKECVSRAIFHIIKAQPELCKSDETELFVNAVLNNFSALKIWRIIRLFFDFTDTNIPVIHPFFDNGDPRCQWACDGACQVDSNNPCPGIYECEESKAISSEDCERLETNAIIEDWQNQCELREKAEDLLKIARDSIYMLQKDEDRGITKEEQNLVEKIDKHFGVCTPENYGKKTFRLTES